ncbi:MAG: nuclear transport factor 2 family protein [Myxococcota bacterium]
MTVPAALALVALFGAPTSAAPRAGAVTVEQLEAFAQAWNRHDVDALMAAMTDDCVYEASVGPELSGKRYVGKVAVRRAFEELLARFPDAQWTNPKHFIAGNRGVTEWVFTATAPDGTRIVNQGCDVFTFANGKIAVKSAYRKRPS